jgi:hypothetical protein
MLALLSSLRLRCRVAFGRLLNLAGIPGLIRSCDYKAGITDARIRVRVGEMFTVITVDGLDIYFHRLTGQIDGVGLAAGCDGPQARLEAFSLARFGHRNPPIHT